MSARRSLAVAVGLMLGLVGCSLLPPPTQPPTAKASIRSTAAPTPDGTGQAAAYPLAPPAEIQDWLRTTVGVGFRPLTDTERRLVVAGPDVAEARALAEPGPGYGPGRDRFTWTKTGCLFLGYYVGPREPSYGYVPPEFPAYLVQVLAKPVKDFPGQNVEVEVIDARTGGFSVAFGYAPGPVLGTTCGAQP